MAGTKALIDKALRRSARVVVTDGMPVHQLLVSCFLNNTLVLMMYTLACSSQLTTPTHLTYSPSCGSYCPA
eukprot:SAG31_NODE_16707_length_699_cov_0.866667_2_plen_71_part_00